MRFRSRTWLVLAAALLGACGDDDAAPAKDAGMDSGEGGKGGSGPKAGSGGSMAVATIMCAANTCTSPEIDVGAIMMAFPNLPVPPDVIKMFLPPPQVCCTDADTCGVTEPTLIPSGECIEQAQQGEPNDKCPGVMTEIMGFAVPLAGCCKITDECGIDLGVLGVDCLERTEFSKLGMMGAMNVDAGATDAAVPALEAIGCTHSSNVGNDAGTNDAGH